MKQSFLSSRLHPFGTSNILELDLSFLYMNCVCALFHCMCAKHLAYCRHLVNASSSPCPFPSHISLSITSESFFSFPVSPAPFHQLSTSAIISFAVVCVAHSFAPSPRGPCRPLFLLQELNRHLALGLSHQTKLPEVGFRFKTKKSYMTRERPPATVEALSQKDEK